MLLYYDQMIEYARTKKRSRRKKNVNQSVPNPIVVLVIGDQQAELVENIYAQLTARWSSRLNAVRVLYFYQHQPCKGNVSKDITQIQLGDIPADKSGPGTLELMPETLRQVNIQVAKVLEEIGQVPGIVMYRAWIPVILAPTDAAQALFSDLLAVVCAQMEELGILEHSTRLYLLLPQIFSCKAEEEATRRFLEQLKQIREAPYEQTVLQLVSDAPARAYKSKQLLDTVVILDEVDQYNRRYNMHGERLQLLCDLIEHTGTWSADDYIQTAGVQDSRISPEYWLAQAVHELCGKIQMMDEGTASYARAEQNIKDCIEQCVKDHFTDGVEKALQHCVVFIPDALDRLSTLSLAEGERAVFGDALMHSFERWTEEAATPRIPAEIRAEIEQIYSNTALEDLARDLQVWAADCESHCTSSFGAADCKKLVLQNEPDIIRKAATARRFFAQMKYGYLLQNEIERAQAKMAKECAKLCYQRIGALKTENEEFIEFSQAIQQAWETLRDGQGSMFQAVAWQGERPNLLAVRRACAAATRTGDPTEVFDAVANCIDLDDARGMDTAQIMPTLYCHIPITLSLTNDRRQTIETGISTGRVLRLICIAHDYDAESIGLVYLLQKLMTAHE